MVKVSRFMTVSVVVSFVIMLVLSGCSEKGATGGNSQQSAASGQQGSNGAGSADASKLDFVELRVAMPASPQKDTELVEEEINKILMEKVNAKLKIDFVDWAKWGEQKSFMLSLGENVDMLFTASWDGFYPEVGRNSYVPLNDLLEKYGQDILKAMLPGYIDAATVKGNIYAVPVNKDQASGFGFKFAVDLAESIGISAADYADITYLEDMEPLLRTAKEKLPKDVWPIYLQQGSNGMHSIPAITKAAHEMGLSDESQYNFFINDSVVYDIKTGKVTPTYEMKEVVDQARLLHKWFKLGYINSDAASTQMMAKDAIRNNKSLTYIQNLSPIIHMSSVNDAGKELFKEGLELKPPVKGDVHLLGAATAIPVTSKHPERAVMVLNEFFKDNRLMNLISYGIEGRHYTKVSDTVMRFTDNRGDYNPDVFWEIGNWYIEPTGLYTEEGIDPNIYVDLKNYLSSVPQTLTLGFTLDTDPIKTEIAAHRNVMLQYNYIFSNGIVDPDATLEEMRKADKAAGIDKIVAEYEKQIKEWLATR